MDLSFTKKAAANSLTRATYPPRKLALLHAAISLGLPLIVTALNLALNHGIAETGGLSGIGLRSILSSAQMILSLSVSILLPFWEIGFLRAALGMARSESVGPRTLTEGFRRLWPVLRLLILQLLVIMGVISVCSYVASFIYFMTPLSAGLVEVLEGLVSQADVLTDAMIMEILPHLIPVYVLIFLLTLAVGIPLFYRFRMAQFAMMDDPTPRARQAMGISFRITKGNCIALFKVDLRFWWFYAAQLVVAVLAYLDVLLPAVGITLPLDPDVTYFLFYGIYVVAQLALAWRFASFVQTTYAHCYCTLKQKGQAEDTIHLGQLPDGGN